MRLQQQWSSSGNNLMGFRFRPRRVIFVLLYISITCVILKSIIHITYVQDGNNIHTFHPNIYWKNKTNKLILLWTKTWGDTYWTEVDKFGLPSCARRCSITLDQSKVSEADAILFHWGNLWWWTKLPAYRRQDQIWAFYNSEPPHKQANIAAWNNIFNWSISYRRDSTVFIPFGTYEPLTESEKLKASGELSSRDYASEKKYNISLTYSNCYNDARRYRLAEEINKIVSVDMYGKCNKHVCLFNTPECDNKLKLYKFHLALENSYCKDYFTEKFWETFDKEVVPIVAWKQSPGELVPSHSYINIFDFPDVNSFTDYLKKVLANDTLYNSYFEWKRKYKIGSHYNNQWCPICDQLHNQSIPAQVIRDPYQWLHDDYCDPFGVSIKNISTHLCLMEFLALINWTNQFQI